MTILGLLLGLVVMIGFMNYVEINGEKTNCYDGHNNKIIGEKCIVENSFESEEVRMYLSISLAITILIGFFIFGCMFDDMENIRRKFYNY